MAQREVRISPVVMRAVRRIARRERCTPNEVLEAALRSYQRDLEMLRQIQKEGQRAARRAGIRSMEDIDRIVHEVRAERRARGT